MKKDIFPGPFFLVRFFIGHFLAWPLFFSYFFGLFSLAFFSLAIFSLAIFSWAILSTVLGHSFLVHSFLQSIHSFLGCRHSNHRKRYCFTKRQITECNQIPKWFSKRLFKMVSEFIPRKLIKGFLN